MHAPEYFYSTFWVEDLFISFQGNENAMTKKIAVLALVAIIIMVPAMVGLIIYLNQEDPAKTIYKDAERLFDQADYAAARVKAYLSPT